MKEYEFFNASENGAELKESLDRSNRHPHGGYEKDEDQEIISANDPQKRFIPIEEVSDGSFEQAEAESEEYEHDYEEDDRVPKEETMERPEEDYHMHDLNPEHTGVIGAAHISKEENTITINREKSAGDDKQEEPVEKTADEDDVTEEEYPHKRTSNRDYETSARDNLKTMPEKKKERNFREKIANLLSRQWQ